MRARCGTARLPPEPRRRPTDRPTKYIHQTGIQAYLYKSIYTCSWNAKRTAAPVAAAARSCCAHRAHWRACAGHRRSQPATASAPPPHAARTAAACSTHRRRTQHASPRRASRRHCNAGGSSERLLARASSIKLRSQKCLRWHRPTAQRALAERSQTAARTAAERLWLRGLSLRWQRSPCGADHQRSRRQSCSARHHKAMLQQHNI